MQPLPQRLDLGRGLAARLALRCGQALGNGVGVADSLVDHRSDHYAGIYQRRLCLADERMEYRERLNAALSIPAPPTSLRNRQSL